MNCKANLKFNSIHTKSTGTVNQNMSWHQKQTYVTFFSNVLVPRQSFHSNDLVVPEATSFSRSTKKYSLSDRLPFLLNGQDSLCSLVSPIMLVWVLALLFGISADSLPTILSMDWYLPDNFSLSHQ